MEVLHQTPSLETTRWTSASCWAVSSAASMSSPAWKSWPQVPKTRRHQILLTSLPWRACTHAHTRSLKILLLSLIANMFIILQRFFNWWFWKKQSSSVQVCPTITWPVTSQGSDGAGGGATGKIITDTKKLKDYFSLQHDNVQLNFKIISYSVFFCCFFFKNQSETPCLPGS